ncbi:MAG: cupin domain-containing protein [Promethearchaeota archaeon]
MSSIFPEIIVNLPEADIPIKGLKAYILQGERQQIIFMEFSEDIEIPEHSHEAQWGVVLKGRIELTIAGEKNILTKGDTYFIQKDISHSAKIYAGYSDVTFFNQKDRYEVKEDNNKK